MIITERPNGKGTENSKHVFISYCSKNGKIAESFKALLESEGIKCWMAPDSIAAGSNYGVAVPEAIDNCSAFVLLLSEESQRSIWVPKELDLALFHGKLIIPLFIAPCKLIDPFRFYLSNIQTTNMYPYEKAVINKAVARIKSQIREAQSDIIVADSNLSGVIDDTAAPTLSLEDFITGEKPVREYPVYTGSYSTPPIDLLRNYDRNEPDRDELAQAAENLERVVSQFIKAEAKVVNIVVGPVVTRYELEIPTGIAMKQISLRTDDIEYELASCGKIFIEAPIPGKRAIGIEVPNKVRAAVSLRSCLEDPLCRSSNPFEFPIGKSVDGETVLCDITKIPHILVGGQAGSGKSAFLNSLMISLMYKTTPEDLRFIIIDPKRVEFNEYKNIPHLLLDRIITHNENACNAFSWACDEMERRYALISKRQCRNIAEYNELGGVRNRNLEKLPHLVIIVDELAELMMSEYRGNIEQKIKVLTAKGRAAGIHLILATQRPTVDIITGTIKANLSSRIAFRMSSQIDSRILLDTAGAERLNSNGDMLYFPASAAYPKRVQGCYVSGEEIRAVIKYVTDYSRPDVNAEINAAVFNRTAPVDACNDPLIPRVLDYAIKQNAISVSTVQRRFCIGFARSARIIDYLEDEGYIGPSTGNSKPRKILITRERFRELFGDFDD